MKSLCKLFTWLVVLGVGYIVFRHHLPPQTALASARAISGLPLPRSSEIMSIERRGFDGPRGDGVIKIVVRLSADAFARVAEEAKTKGYRPLRDDPEAGPTFLGHPVGSKGWYRRDRSGDGSGSSRSIVLDAASHTILMQQVIG